MSTPEEAGKHLIDAATGGKWAGGGAVGAFLSKMAFDWFKRGGSVKRIREDVASLQNDLKAVQTVNTDIQVIQATILARMVTKDDFAEMLEKIENGHRRNDENLTLAMQVGFTHAHERIDELYLHLPKQ